MSKLKPRLICAVLLALFFGVSLWLRVYLPYDKVFSGGWIKFTGNDAYYYMRLVDNLIHNFPHLTGFDPYAIYPDGSGVSNISFFGRLLAGITWAIGLGSPSEHLIDVVGVYFPAILGALTIIPVYFIGKELFGRWAGVLAAGLIAILPGEFLGRSILGFTDHHIAETLFTTITMLFLILAIKSASQKQITFSHLKRHGWTTSVKPVIYSLLAGIFLGIYIFTFAGALLFVFLTFLYFVIQFIIDHLKSKSTDYLCMVGIIFFFTTLIISLLISLGIFFLAPLIIASLMMPILNSISRLMINRRIKPTYYPLTIIGIGLAGLGILYLINPVLISAMLSSFSIFRPTGASLTTIEMQPIFRPWSDLPLALVWGNFSIGFFLSIIALGILIYLVIKQGNPEKSLLVVWSLVILAATIGQRRFAYYFAVNIAVLSGYLTWQALRLAGFQETTSEPAEIAKDTKRKKTPPRDRHTRTMRYVNEALAVLIAVLIVYLPNVVKIFPNIPMAIETASEAPFTVSNAWVDSMYWLKANTPEPFGNPDSYYQPNRPLAPGEKYQYPDSAYGVMAWWDYGYWITRIAHRIPNVNPSQKPGPIINVANFFTSQDEDSANKIRRELGSAYIITDVETTTSKFWAVATWAQKAQSEFFDIYLVPQENKLTPVQLFYPEYYYSIVTRLHNFNGQAVTPTKSMVVSFQENSDQQGNRYKVITSAQEFDSYQKATDYIASQNSTNYRIVGIHPFISPVPLEALQNYRLIYSSPDSVALPNLEPVPAVKIFEYTGTK
ncbi:MAG: oligosaccharyl transferase, archaeosortase A system-associated [Chloroflexi bacterium]|nr:oligosaccharyl transferase, archaeosortase A system-associated [Chloroflexota bacterium]